MIPLIVVAGAAVAVVLVLRSGPGRAERQMVTSYVRAWAAGDYHQMYSLLSPASRQGMSEPRFAAAYRRDDHRERDQQACPSAPHATPTAASRHPLHQNPTCHLAWNGRGTLTVTSRR